MKTWGKKVQKVFSLLLSAFNRTYLISQSAVFIIDHGHLGNLPLKKVPHHLQMSRILMIKLTDGGDMIQTIFLMVANPASDMQRREWRKGKGNLAQMRMSDSRNIRNIGKRKVITAIRNRRKQKRRVINFCVMTSTFPGVVCYGMQTIVKLCVR